MSSIPSYDPEKEKKKNMEIKDIKEIGDLL